jgi:pilus assembly protein FimV
MSERVKPGPSSSRSRRTGALTAGSLRRVQPMLPLRQRKAARQQAVGKITTRVEDKAAPAAEPKDQLKVSKDRAPPQQAGVPASKRADEDLIAKEKALQGCQRAPGEPRKECGRTAEAGGTEEPESGRSGKQSAAGKGRIRRPKRRSPVEEPEHAASPAAPRARAAGARYQPGSCPPAPVADPRRAAFKACPTGNQRCGGQAGGTCGQDRRAQAGRGETESAPSCGAPKPVELPKAARRCSPPPPVRRARFFEELLTSTAFLAAGAIILALLAAYWLAKRRRRETGEDVARC